MSKMTAKAFVDKAVDIAKNYKTLYVMGLSLIHISEPTRRS